MKIFVTLKSPQSTKYIFTAFYPTEGHCGELNIEKNKKARKKSLHKLYISITFPDPINILSLFRNQFQPTFRIHFKTRVCMYCFIVVL